MGFRFHRTVGLLPGLRLNLSKSGVSTSIGTRGAWLTFGKRGTRATVGIPGTGISYTETLPHGQQSVPRQNPLAPSRPAAGWLLLALLAVLAIGAVIGWAIAVGQH